MEGTSQGWTSYYSRIFQGFSTIAPAWLVRAGIPTRRVRTVSVAELPLSAATIDELSRAGRHGAPVEIALDPSLFLRKTITIPAAARRSTPAAIAVQLRQTLPAQADGLIWRAQFARGRGREAEYNVFILKRDRLTGLLRDVGFEPRRVVIGGVDGIQPLIDNRHRVDRPERFWHRATATLCGLVVVATLAFQTWHLSALHRQEDAIRAEVLTLREQATAARQTVEARNAAAAVRLRDEARLRADSQRLSQLAGLTKALDDDVWLTSAAFDEDVLRLAGFARSDVAAVVASIRALPWVSSVTAEGSISVDQATGEARFQLTVHRRKTDDEE